MARPKNDLYFERFRVMARGIFMRGGSLLVVRGMHATKGNEYFVLPGGNMKFDETSRQAFMREMREELGERLVGVRYLGVIENLFGRAGKRFHEVGFFYTARFADKSVYSKRKLELVEDNGAKSACYWIPLKDFSSGKRKLYPRDLPAFIEKNKKDIYWKTSDVR